MNMYHWGSEFDFSCHCTAGLNPPTTFTKPEALKELWPQNFT